MDEAIEEAYCWRRSGFFWRMRASLGLACAQATTLSSQVFGKGNPRSRALRSYHFTHPVYVASRYFQ